MSMKILLINPPNCGKSIPEERYGIDSIKQILRGEPLSLEVLAGALFDHEVIIMDLKADNRPLEMVLDEFHPDLVGITGMTCEANTMIKIASQVKSTPNTIVVVGGIHASNCPEFFNRPEVDYIVVGLGKASLSELVSAIETKKNTNMIPGVIKTGKSRQMKYITRDYGTADLMEDRAPRYDLVEDYRQCYFLPSLGIQMGFVVTAYGCPYRCSFCAIHGQAGGKYLTHGIESVIRDISVLRDIPFIRLVDANTFGNPDYAECICESIVEAGIKKDFMVDVRADTVVHYSDLLRKWKQAGLRAVVIGFEEVNNQRLRAMNKKINLSLIVEAIHILKELGVSIVGDFIISPDYDESQFEALELFIQDNPVDLPMYTVLTPLPGTPLYRKMKNRIIIEDLDYYTLTNAVVSTRLEENTFYTKYAKLLSTGHKEIQI